jgi:ubiquinone/menaquinone biosynthesis C-methylase UbiE
MARASAAAAYGAWFETALGRRVWADERRALGAVLDPVAGRTVLDAGCGDGRWSLALGDQGAQVVGVDGDAVMLQAARRRCGRGRGRPILVRADVALPFANGAFDLVTAVTVLCVAARPLAVVRELARVVRVGGDGTDRARAGGDPGRGGRIGSTVVTHGLPAPVEAARDSLQRGAARGS